MSDQAAEVPEAQSLKDQAIDSASEKEQVKDVSQPTEATPLHADAQVSELSEKTDEAGKPDDKELEQSVHFSSRTPIHHLIDSKGLFLKSRSLQP